MSIDVVTQFRAKPGRAGELLALVLGMLPAARRPEGCLDVRVRQNQDDANDIVAEQTWQSRQQAERWRADPHTLTSVRALLAEPMQVRCFEVVESGADPARALPTPADPHEAPRRVPAEMPKVSTPDALGG